MSDKEESELLASGGEEEVEEDQEDKFENAEEGGEDEMEEDQYGEQDEEDIVEEEEEEAEPSTFKSLEDVVDVDAAWDRMEEFDRDCEAIPCVKEFAEATGIPPAAVGMTLIITALVIVAYKFPYGDFATAIIGTVYPCFKSIAALQTKREDDDKEWLTYWIVFGFFTCIDFYASVVLDMIPYYWLMRLTFLVYLYFPLTKGALVLHENCIKPLVDPFKEDIIQLRNKLEDVTEELADQAIAAGEDLAEEGVKSYVRGDF